MDDQPHTTPAAESAEKPTESQGLVSRAADRVPGGWIEIAAAALLALATVTSAWAAYQATRWTGVQATAFSTAATLRAESVRASNVAAAQRQVDIATLMQWIDATAQDRTALADFYRERFRPEFVPAFDAWLGSVPAGEVPPGTPFALPEYQLEQDQLSDSLEEQASEQFQIAKDANQTGDNFVLTAVLMASVLFFAGISQQFEPPVRYVLITIGVMMFLAGGSLVILLPQNVGF